MICVFDSFYIDEDLFVVRFIPEHINNFLVRHQSKHIVGNSDDQTIQIAKILH